MSFDAQCDPAAVVYGPDDDPDRMITGFAADLRRSGRRPVGVVLLACRRDALDRWWLSVTGLARRRGGAGTFCEFAK